MTLHKDITPDEGEITPKALLQLGFKEEEDCHNLYGRRLPGITISRSEDCWDVWVSSVEHLCEGDPVHLQLPNSIRQLWHLLKGLGY
jgi:hypothetical protein